MKIKWIRGTENLKEAYKIRREVFVIEQNVPEDEEWDQYDKTADHVLLSQNGMAMGTGRLAIIDGRFTLGRIAVLKEYRGQDIGRIVMENLMKKAKEIGAKEVYIHAQIQALEFYKKLNFKAYGEKYMEAGIEHISMKAELNDFDKGSLGRS